MGPFRGVGGDRPWLRRVIRVPPWRIKLPATIASVPAISVVLPVHNGNQHVEAAVRSILAQSFRDFELVIGDDGSDDGTATTIAGLAAQDSRIRIIRRATKSGVAGAANWVVQTTRAPLVAIAHADDLSSLDRLQCQFELMRDRPDCVLCGSVFTGIDWHGSEAHSPNLWRLAYPSAFAPLAHSSTMFRRAEFDQAGGYRATANYWEDLDLYWRLAQLGTILVATRPLSTYRYSQISIREREAAAGIEAALEQMYRSAAAVSQGVMPEPVPPHASANRIHPRIFVARSWTRVWARERTRLLPDLIRRGRLGFDLATVQSLGFVSWATLSPRSLRVVLRLLTRLRNWIARRRIGTAPFVEWRPLAGGSGADRPAE